MGLSGVFLRIALVFAALGLFADRATAGVMLTAEVYDTPGLPGYRTYDLTASSPGGFVNGFSFLNAGGDGILGPLHQGSPPGEGDALFADRLFGLADDSIDTRWLVSPEDGLQIGASQSSDGLGLAYTFLGDSNYQHRNLPLVRLTTNDPSSVRIAGDFDIGFQWSDGTRGTNSKQRVETWLADVPISAAPAYSGYPEVPAAVLAERAAEAQRIAELEDRLNAEQQARDQVIADRKQQEHLQQQAETEARRQALEAERLAEAEAARLAQEAADPTALDPPTIHPIEQPTVTIDEYQQGLDQRAELIRQQIEQLNGQLVEVEEQRKASESPGFEVPSAGYFPIVSVPIRSVELSTYTLPEHLVTLNAISSVFTIDIASTQIALSDIISTRANIFDADGVVRNIDAPRAGEVFASIPEPGTLFLAALASATILRRRA